jgi:hypothetical protein
MIQSKAAANHSSICTWLYFGMYESVEASRPIKDRRDETAEKLQPPGDAWSVKE